MVLKALGNKDLGEVDEYLAHSKNEDGLEHRLSAHLIAVADLMVGFTENSEYQKVFKVTGLLHDLGKYQPAFQTYLREGGRRGSVPHASWGAAIAAQNILIETAFAIDGHHKGLPNKADLKVSISEFKDSEHPIHNLKPTFYKETGTENTVFKNEKQQSWEISEREVFIRFLFSALTDADWLNTENHFAPQKASKRPSEKLEIEYLLHKLEEEYKSKSKEGWLNLLRNEVREFAIKNASLEAGFYSMTLPTGMGKTLASISWALHHANKNGLKRIIIVLPFISIIDQTVGELKRIFGEEFVLEHHSNFNEDDENNNKISDEGIQDNHQSKRLAIENWDFPIIVTTTVQFFESLFSNKPSKCRKVHNIAKAVVIFDEVQSLPKELILPTITMLKDVQKIMGTSFLFCTATLPAFEKRERFAGIDNIVPLVQNPSIIFSKTRRVNYKPLNSYKPTDLADLYEQVYWQDKSALCIFNTKQMAREFCKFIEGGTDYWWVHLSTYLCPIHRRKIIQVVKDCLKRNKRIILSSTQLVEAGVDFDFPTVFREIAPLESVIQSAGRCNREGKYDYGDVYIFRLMENKAPNRQYLELAEFALQQYKGNEEKLFGHDFFTEYYKNAIDLFCDPDRKQINQYRNSFNFETVAELYKLIDSKTTPIFIFNYNEDSRELYKQIVHKPFLSRDDYRAMQQYTVQVYDNFLQTNAHLIGTEKEGFRVWHGKYDSHYGICADINKELDILIH